MDDLFKNISTLIFDVDGVLTDGSVLVLENGLQARRMSIRDGYALQLAVRRNYRLLVISGAAASPVVERLAKLGISEIHMGVTGKEKFIRSYIAEQGIASSEVLYMGDDLPDLAAMKLVGLSACPADAAPEVKEAATYISPFAGGHGCARDVIEKVLKAHGHWYHEDELASR
jgi:3-deoxy-D-manno-octulosonate 8-phosphate phosphatase (KDO 8-P phosphatase)